MNATADKPKDEKAAAPAAGKAADKPKAEAKPKPEKKEKGPSIGSVAMDVIRKGATNQEALEVVQKQFPDCNTTLASINWYRTKLRKDGEPVKSSRELKAAATEASGEKPKGKAKDKAGEKDPLD